MQQTKITTDLLENDYLLMTKFNPNVITSIKNHLRGHSFLETAKVPEGGKKASLYSVPAYVFISSIIQ